MDPYVQTLADLCRHFALFFRGGQIVPGPFFIAALVQIEDADDPLFRQDLILSDVQIQSASPLFPQCVRPAGTCAAWPRGHRLLGKQALVHMQHLAPQQRRQPVILAAGDEHLSSGDAVEDEFLAAGVQL